MPSEPITTAQAAAILGVSVRRVQTMIRDGLLPQSKKVGRDWLLDEKEVRVLAVKERPAHRPGKARNDNCK